MGVYIAISSEVGRRNSKVSCRLGIAADDAKWKGASPRPVPNSDPVGCPLGRINATTNGVEAFPITICSRIRVAATIIVTWIVCCFC